MNDTCRQTKFLKDYAPPDYLIEAVALDVSLEPTTARVSSKLTMHPNPKAEPGRPLVLDGESRTGTFDRYWRTISTLGGTA